MLQKLENAYLAILRFIVILIATGLLVAVAIFGAHSFKLLSGEPHAEDFVPSVSDKGVLDKVIGKDEANQAPRTQASGHDEPPQKDPNQIYYDRLVTTISAFVQKYEKPAEPGRHVEMDENGVPHEVPDAPAPGPVVVNKEWLANHVKQVCDAFDSDARIAACAKGLADVMDKTLAEKTVIARAQATAATKVVDQTIDAYRSAFQASIDEHEAKIHEAQADYEVGQVKAMNSLYWALGSMGAFLTIVFLSILIKIERNLRHLAPRE